MRRLARISEVLGSEEALVVAVRLLAGPVKQKDLVAELRDAGIPRAQPRLSELMKPLQDLGIVTRSAGKAPYELTHADETAAFIQHLAALAGAIAGEDAATASEVEKAVSRTRLRPAPRLRRG